MTPPLFQLLYAPMYKTPRLTPAGLAGRATSPLAEDSSRHGRLLAGPPHPSRRGGSFFVLPAARAQKTPAAMGRGRWIKDSVCV